MKFFYEVSKVQKRSTSLAPTKKPPSKIRTKDESCIGLQDEKEANFCGAAFLKYARIN